MDWIRHTTLVFASMLWAACVVAAEYRGTALDTETGKPVAGMRVLCRGYVVDHGMGNWLKYKVAGGDFADTDTMILDATVTGADGTFRLDTGVGRPWRTVSVNKNGDYGVFDHSVPLTANMVVRIKDEPLQSSDGETAAYRPANPDPGSGRLLLATHTRGNGYVYCLDGTTGDCRWRDRIFWDATAPVAAIGGRAFVGTEAGIIFAYDIASGERLWQRQTHQEVTQICHDADHLYVAAGPGREEILALDQATGRVARRIDTGTKLDGVAFSSQRLMAWSDSAVHLFKLPLRKKRTVKTRTEIFVPGTEGSAYLLGRSPKRGNRDCLLTSRSWRDLSVRWRRTLPQERFWRRCFLAEGGVLFAVGDTNIDGNLRTRICALDADTGELLWTNEGLHTSVVKNRWELPGESSEVFVDGRASVVCMPSSDGQLLWDGTSMHVLAGNRSVKRTGCPVSRWHGKLSRVEPATGATLWSYPLSGRITPHGLPASTASDLYVVAGDGDGMSGVTRLSGDSGEPYWRFRVSGLIVEPVTCVAAEGATVDGND